MLQRRGKIKLKSDIVDEARKSPAFKAGKGLKDKVNKA